MLYSFRSWLKEIGKVCDTQSIEIGVVVGDEGLAGVGIPSRGATVTLDTVDPPVDAFGLGGGSRHYKRFTLCSLDP